MPKVYDKSAAGKKQSLLAQGALGGRQALTQNLRGLTYEAGVAALGLDLQTVGEDPQNLGLDPATLTEDLALILKELQPVYDPYYLQCRDTAAAVAAAYAGDGSGKSSADGRFNITLNELVLRTTDGAGWERTTAPVSTHLTGIEAVDALDATVDTPDGRRFRTVDGGASWVPLP